MNLNKFCLETLGCKANQYDGQSIREQFISRGYTEVASCQGADIYIINTCTVTQTSDKKCRQKIKQAARLDPRPKIVVTGCYADRDKEELKDIKEVDFIFTNEQKHSIIDVITNTSKRSQTEENIIETNTNEALWDKGISDFQGHNRAFIKVQDGCESFCSYCIVPYVRGKSRSKEPGLVKEEAVGLAKKGFKEIVLSGIHLGNYGKDLDNKPTLVQLLKKIEAIPEAARIRLSSIEPLEVVPELIEVIKKSPKVCNHLHLSLQSGDGQILKRMNRPYTPQQYLEVINNIKDQIKDVSLTTDILAGFPGEDERAFENTLGLIKEAGYSRIHAFGFSLRPGTAAFDFPQAVPDKVKAQRVKKVKELGVKTSLEYRKRFLGKKVYPLIESQRDKATGLLTGYTDTYIRVLLEGEDNLKNNIVPAKIVEVTEEKTIAEYL